VNSCNRSVTVPTPSCGQTTVKYSYNFCNYELLPLSFQSGICNSTQDGFNGRSGNCSFAYLAGSMSVPMNFTPPMNPKTCRPLNYTATIDTCSPTPSQIQVQGRLSDQTYCRAYIFLRVNWVTADSSVSQKTKNPSRKPTAVKKPTKPVKKPYSKVKP
jgi:hypothetical protein